MTPYDIVDEFEKRIAKYAGAEYGVAVNSCTSGLMLSALYRKITKTHDTDIVKLPKHTYVGVPYSLINAGYKIDFIDLEWKGNYIIDPIDVVDSARRFTKGMYEAGSLYCLSFHETKHLSVGDGGMILTDSKDAYEALRQMRFDGRTPGLSVFEDDFIFPAHHCHMKPDVATKGLMLMAAMKDFNEDLPEKYPDLSQHKIFTDGY